VVPSLLLITNRKSNTGSQLVPNSMTLNAKIGGFYGFWGNFGLRHRFQERIAPKSIEIDMEKLHMKFLAFSIDFGGPSLDFLDSKKPAH